MPKRFVSIWLPSIKTDWLARRQPGLKTLPFVFVLPDHGRMVVTAANAIAEQAGIFTGMALADARAFIPSLEVFDEEPDRVEKILNGLADWFIRYTPVVAVDPPDGLILDASGCAHLWQGEKPYLAGMYTRLKGFGYKSSLSMADTVGTAWAMARFGSSKLIVESGGQMSALLSLPPAALRLPVDVTERLEKLGLCQIGHFINMPASALRRRFGETILQQLNYALGHEEEPITPVQPVCPYQERLPCLEPIATATGIEIALQRLLETICDRLKLEEKGLRSAIFKGYRLDGKVESISIGTNHPSGNPKHLFKLFEDKIATIEPDLGIELFVLEAPVVEAVSTIQEKLFNKDIGLDDIAVAELLDRIAGKFGNDHIQRFVPAEHYWPERSFKPATTLQEAVSTNWRSDKPRPLQLLSRPEAITVTAPVPDYPPMNFRYKGHLHNIAKADGPERIEQEWWLQDGQHRDYYYVEDELGKRYWLFRLGHYDVEKTYQWFIHGFFS